MAGKSPTPGGRRRSVSSPHGEDAFHPDGAQPQAPAAGPAELTPPEARRSAPSKKPRKSPAAAKRAATPKAVAKRAPAPPPGAANEDRNQSEDEEEEDPIESTPEILFEESDDDDDDGEDSDHGGGGLILDVGSTRPSLPSMLTADSQASLPAIRAQGGITRTGALERFLAEMGRYPLLTIPEEQELTLAYFERKDPVAARKLVVHNLRLVVKMAYKYRRAWANVLDLIQEGNLGLVEAVDRFDPFRGAKFSTYASFWIRAYMLRYLLEHSRLVRISRTRVGRKLFFRLSKEREKLRAQGIEPGPKLLAERLGVGQKELEEVVRHMDQSEVRLDAPLYNDDISAGSVLDAMSNDSASPEVQTYRREFENEVSTALESFAATLTDPREKMAWTEHLMSEDPASLSVLGERFGVTKQRMGQIVTGIRKRLKEHLISTLGPDVQLGFSFDSE